MKVVKMTDEMKTDNINIVDGHLLPKQKVKELMTFSRTYHNITIIEINPNSEYIEFAYYIYIKKLRFRRIKKTDIVEYVK